MRSERAWKRRAAVQAAHRLLRDGERYLDLGIKLQPVRKDEAGGTVVIAGLPGVVAAAAAISFGGVYDTLERRWVPERQSDPLVWYASPEQVDIIVHDREKTPEPYQLVYGAEGAGKTQVLAMAGLVKILNLIGKSRRTLYVGLVAPTRKRLKDSVLALREKVPIDTPLERRPDAWGTYYASADEIRFHFGVTVELRAAQQHSAAAGSPIQGRTWAAAIVDEDQDVVELGRDPDIEARLRGVKGTERISTATAKDSPTWRMARDKRIATGDWAIKRLPWFTNAFEWAERWEKFARNLSKRERLRRMEAQDVAPELAVYYNWEHSRNIAPTPDLAIDVTAGIVAGCGYASYVRPGAELALVIGHDPGLIFQTSVLLRAYLVRNDVVWYVVDEYISGPGRHESDGKSVTARQHARGLREHLQRKYGLCYDIDPMDRESGMQRAVALSDPHDRGEKHPDEDVYAAFAAEGVDIFSAAESANMIKRRARQEMINGLLEGESGQVRLYVAATTSGDIRAGEVVVSFETLQRDASGESERDRKGIQDKTHPAVATGYGLWPFERETSTEYTRDIARKAARR